MKKCKVCKVEFKQVYSTTQNTCSVTCAVQLANQKKQSDWKKRKQYVKEELRTIQDYIKIAQQVVNKYIRLRDKDSSCFTCGAKLGSKYDAGHFFSAGGHWAVRFDERNIHAQCVNCNQYKHGNLIEYQKRLVAHLGYDEYALLDAESKKTRNYAKEELKEIIQTYKNKIKELNLNP